MSVHPALLRSLALDAVAIEAVREFRRHGLEPILLKGRSIAERLYCDGTIRTYSDVDLLVPPGRHRQAGQVLAGLGFRDHMAGARDCERARHADAWIRPADGAVVDLHRTLSGVAGEPSLVWAVLCDHIRPLVIGAESVASLDDVGLALHLPLHAARQGWRAVKPLADLRLALAAFDHSVMDQAAELAGRLDALPDFVAGLRLLPEGEDLSARYGRGLRIPAAVVVRIATGERGTRFLSEVFAATGRRRLLVLAHHLFPSRMVLRHAMPLARRGRLALLAAYAVRLSSLAVALPAALRAWRVASRR